MNAPSSARPLALLVAGLLAGCATQSKHAPPVVEVPATWREQPASSAAPASHPLPLAWWTIFQDPELDALQAQVLAANPDLQQAIARVNEARAVARLSEAARSPSLTAGNAIARERTSENEARGSAGPREFTTHRTGFDLSFEVDLWHRHAQAASAARSDAMAVEQDFHAARLAITAEAARHYHALRAIDEEARVLEATVALRRDTVVLQTTRHDAGLINETDVVRAQTELATAEADTHALARQRARLEHALAALCGRPAAMFAIAPRAAGSTAPAIPVGLPSELLLRRPDVAVAEHRLDATSARIAVARADFFPRIGLTASAGQASADLNDLLRSDSQTWSFGPTLHLPLFDGGRLRANLAAEEARYEQSAARYRAVVLNAFREVEDALAERRTLDLEAAAVHRALAAAKQTAALASSRYERGLSNYLDVVDAQRGVLNAERDAAHLRGQQLAATILLAKALGGGWQRPPADRLAGR